MTTFYRLLKDTDKADALRTAVTARRSGDTDEDRTFTVDPAVFSKVPNTPFAYWVDDEIRDLFVKLPPFESEGRTVKQGLATADDFRFVRAWWEVDPARRLDPGLAGAPDWREDLEGFQAWCRGRTHEGKGWAPFAKGGEYSPYYSDIHLVVNWEREGEEMKAFAGSVIRNPDYYFRPGVTWPRRTNSRFGPYACPGGVVFGDKGPVAFADPSSLYLTLGLMFSEFYREFIDMFVAGGDETESGTPSRSYEVGIVRGMPYPEPNTAREGFDEQVAEIVAAMRERRVTQDSSTESFAGLDIWRWVDGPSALIDTILERSYFPIGRLLDRFRSINERAFLLLVGLTDSEGPDSISALLESSSGFDEEGVEQHLTQNTSQLTEQLVERFGGNREYSVKSFYVDRKVELISALTKAPVSRITEDSISNLRKLAPERIEIAQNLAEIFVGSAFARWDLRLASNPDLVPALPDPFDPLPVVPPATLVGPDGLPATSGKIVSEEWLRARPNAITLPPAGSVTTPTITDDEYPIPIPWDGILVDEPDHPADIVTRTRQVLTILHGEGAQQVEEELCGELGLDTLREYIANPKGFFADHLKRYTKSKRKAPIYWPLSTPSGGWTAWIYYPRLTDATIYTLIEHYVHKRLDLVRQLYEDVAAIPAASRSPGQQRQFDLSSRDKDELAAMEEELKGIAAMPYRVNHDDGVPILAAPFAGMFRHREWAKYLTGIWEKLETGEYDWAHLAYAIWPERVREKARDDRSIAIAHGIEEAQ